MRIIEWNCRYGGFQKKKEEILKCKPDILVVPECENTECLTFCDGTKLTSTEWINDGCNKYGIGVFGFNGFRLKKLAGCDNVKFFGAFSVFREETELNLLVAWANNTGSGKKYHEIVEKAIDHYGQLLRQPKTLFIGDFNTPGNGNNLVNQFFLGYPKSENSYLKKHQDIVKALDGKGLKSVYHVKSGEKHGHETTATYFHNKCIVEPFHCDYCFASEDLRAILSSVQIGKFNNWKKHSDHMPLIVDFNL